MSPQTLSISRGRQFEKFRLEYIKQV